MSSPYIPHHGDFPDRRVASSPVNSTMTALDLQEPLIRPMRLKVLYSFDLENKTNCLARWPEILNIRTAYLDEATQIGVIELKTCIRAIVASSPEIVAKFDQDYTVYAYDYSEYDTPQVGQGMLSRVLASASTTPGAPAHQSDTVVTGRVCKSMLGLFANGIQETLEVKLRLVPVPNSVQHEYAESMRQQRESSQGMPEGVDPRAWNEFLKQNPGMMSALNQSRSQSPSISFSQPQRGIEQVQRLMSEGYRPQSVRPQSLHRQASYTGSIVSGQASNRSGSPTPSLQSMATTQPHYVRSASRVSNEDSQIGGRRMSTHNPSEMGYDEERNEEGPARKRARVMKADHPGRSTLGKTFDTLRATASTAASIRVLQPTAMRPSTNAIRSLEAPPRVPTPTPGGNFPGRRPQLLASKSGLGREMTSTSDSGYRSYSEDVMPYSESVGTSPDNGAFQSDYNSPEEPASSPPVIRPPSVAPTSPMLPAMPHHQVNSFNHPDLDDLFGGTAPGIDTPWLENDVPNPAARSAGRASTEAPLAHSAYRPSAGPSQAQLDEEAAKAKQMEASRGQAQRAIGLKRTQTWSGEKLHSDPAPARPKPQPQSQRQRSTSTVDIQRPRSRSNNWNKDKRRQAMQTKLKATIEAGQMPPYCENCGVIETPTWRKAFSRMYGGDHSHLCTSEDEGGIVCIQVVETNDDGSTKLFKVFKKSLLPDDEAFSDVLLCNPCGIWLSNKKTMRPENQWMKKEGQAKKRRSRSKKKQGDETDMSDAANAFSDGAALASEASMAPIAFGGDAALDEPAGDRKAASLAMPALELSTLMPEEEGDGQLPGTNITTADFAALQRAIACSPGRFLGSRKSPIEVDKQSPDPARRSLFSSPKSGGPLGVDMSMRPPSVKKTHKVPPKTPNEIRLAVTDEDAADKENQPPQPVEIDDLDDLFSDLPTTPSRKRGAAPTFSPGALFKTPAPTKSPFKLGMATGDFFSSAAKAFLHAPRTPNKTPSKALAEMTPFTRHLNQLLSEPQLESPSRFLSEIGYSADTGPSMTDGGTPSKMFRSGDFSLGDFPSSDGPMPSSPPGWFGVYEDAEAPDAPWDLEFGSSPAKGVPAVEKKGKTEEKSPSEAPITTAASVEATSTAIAA